MSMFCYQCQEAAKGIGCSIKGVCGKSPEVSNLQDLLLFTLKGISFYKDKTEIQSISHPEVDKFMIEGLFSTITNANFDENVFYQKIRQAITYRELVKRDFLNKGGRLDLDVPEAAMWYAIKKEDFNEKAKSIGVLSTKNEDIRSLRELLIYGLKGMAAYAEHALNLGYLSDNIFKFTYKALAATLNDKLTADELTALVLTCGQHGVEVMALLDKANTDSYGHPEITEVNLGVSNNPGILISGHDLKDMEELLVQSEGTGVDIYTHSEMLPAHYYPIFKKYKHFVGNYGNAWWQQTTEFEKFNGPVLLTTNCLVPPKASYIDRVYTTGQAGFEHVKHISDRESGKAKDFSSLIEHAKKCAPPVELETGTIVGGFAHNQVVQLADKIVDAVKTGAIKKFFVMAGCDGRVKDRNYYTDFASALPEDTVILTAGCAKYRYNKLPLGDIGGIPRVLDAGQCNDSYSLAVIALKLKEIFELEDINDLPIAYNIAWYEQKAVIVLLALLYLGVKDIHLGPTLPAFLSPNVANVLIKNFGISGIGEVESDLNYWMAATAK